MQDKKLLFVGFGDIANRASHALIEAGCAVTGIARSAREVPSGVDYWRGALTDSHIVQQLAQDTFDVAVVTLTPGGRRESDYRRTYLDNSQHLIRLWRGQPTAPKLVIYVSSSSVYHQNDGSWVDETSPTLPTSPTAQLLLEAENAWRDSPINSCVVRFPGIYGPGRTHLLRQVMAGNGGPIDDDSYTNRIHVDDCVGVLLHLCLRHFSGEPVAPLYLASDCLPAQSWEVRSYLAELLGYPAGHLQESAPSARGGNKRCSNALLLASGYRFRYPDYRSGYASQIAEEDGLVT
jgi:nucleoside-diphosphate-sugar epimerase